MSIGDRRESEFGRCIDGTTLPFHELDDSAFNAHNGVNKAMPSRKPKLRGNYIAGYILAQHRIQAKKYQPRWKNLEGIFNLPMELFIQILETLHPIDLYHIILTTRALRTLLLSKSASAIWERSFKAYPEILFYPTGVSAPKWASLLFGPDTCDECGRTNTLPDLVNFTRKCDKGCSDLIPEDKHWLSNLCSADLGKYYSVISRDIWKLARKTYTTDMESLNFLLSYFKKDVTELAFKMAGYLEDISAEIPGATTAYDSFIQETRNAECICSKDARSYYNWARQIMEKCVTAFNASIPKYLHSTEKILVKCGHDPRDIASSGIVGRGRYRGGVKRRWDICSEPVLTKKSAWKTIAIFDEIVADRRKSRLAREHKQRVEKRRDHLNEFYTLTAKAHISSKVAPFLPSPDILQKIPVFQDYLRDKSETVDVTVLLPDAEGLIQRFVASVIHDKKQYLVKIIADAGAVAMADGHESVDDILDLATALFQCCDAHCRVFVGWDEAGVYTNPPSKKTDYGYSTGPRHLKFACEIGGSVGTTLPVVATDSEYGVDLNCRLTFATEAWSTLKEIAELLGVDWRTVPAKVLDALGKRFACKMCTFGFRDNRLVKPAMDWRECVDHRRHVASKSDSLWLKCGSMPAFALLSEEMTRVVRHVEEMYPKPTDLAWACCHCTEFFTDRVTRTAAIAHTWTKHRIHKLVVDRDFFYYSTEGSLMQMRVMSIVMLYADAGHRCLKCQGKYGLRVRFKKDLMMHLMYGHKMSQNEIIEGEHWLKVKPLEDKVWLEEALGEYRSKVEGRGYHRNFSPSSQTFEPPPSTKYQ